MLDDVYKVIDEQTGKPIMHPLGGERALYEQAVSTKLLGRAGNACASWRTIRHRRPQPAITGRRGRGSMRH